MSQLNRFSKVRPRTKVTRTAGSRTAALARSNPPRPDTLVLGNPPPSLMGVRVMCWLFVCDQYEVNSQARRPEPSGWNRMSRVLLSGCTRVREERGRLVKMCRLSLHLRRVLAGAIHAQRDAVRCPAVLSTNRVSRPPAPPGSAGSPRAEPSTATAITGRNRRLPAAARLGHPDE